MPYKDKKEWTMIRLKKTTVKKLRSIKAHPNQSDEEIVGVLLTHYK